MGKSSIFHGKIHEMMVDLSIVLWLFTRGMVVQTRHGFSHHQCGKSHEKPEFPDMIRKCKKCEGWVFFRKFE